MLASKQSDATNTTYGAGGKKSMERNEFTKTYCDTNVYKTNKAITAITRDSLYQAQKQEAIDKFKGFQQLDINQVRYRYFFLISALWDIREDFNHFEMLQKLINFKVGSFKQHMINQENLSDTYYKEDYENEKDLVYFPQTVTQTYENQKKNAEKNFSYDKDAKKKGER